MSTDDELLAHEIECHRFTEPLKPPAHPPSLARRLVARASGRVWWRVGWTCTCVRKVLETAETEMLLRGLIKESLDIYQLQGNASASAGTHSLPGAYDIGQYSDAQIDVQRLCGGDGQHRTRAQGFSMDHCHGFAQGCPHGSSGLMAQKRQWNNRQNGLVSHGPIQGRWPTKKWSTAVAERAKVIVALKDDIINGVVAKLRGEYGAIADAILTRDGKIPNTLTDTPSNKYVSLAGALEALGKRTSYLVNRSITKDGMVKNEYNPADPNNTIAATTALALLLRRQREQGGYADLSAKLDAILAALQKGPQS